MYSIIIKEEKDMKKWINFILVGLSMLVCMMFIRSNNVYAYTQGNMDFSLNDSTKTAVLTNWNGDAKSYLYIPETLNNGYTVTEIGEGAFSHEPGGNGSPTSSGGLINGVSIPNTIQLLELVGKLLLLIILFTV